MSLFRTSLRPPAVLSDEAVERYLAALRADIDPDPAFRRRLRGVVLNRYVAMRETSRVDVLPRPMGRLGRAVLYASFMLGVSVTGVMAASEAAVPGDVLYPLKRAIEEMRVHVLPQQFHDELAVHELRERLSELATLVERGDDAAVEAIVTEFASRPASLDLLTTLDGQMGLRDEVLASLLARLPEPARIAIDRLLEASAVRTSTSPGRDAGSPNDTQPTPAPVVGTDRGQSSDSAEAGRAGGGAATDGTAGDGSDAGNGGGSDEDGGSGTGSTSRGPGTRQTGAIEEPSATPKPKKAPAP